jgi:hypothetical protein
MKNLLTYAIAASSLVAFVSVAQARSAYDGSWDLLFVTQRGACDSTYNFSVNITDGAITHPNLVRFRGKVARSGAVRASVTVPDKYASGSGRLSSNSGRGTWSGYSGSARCSGYGPRSGTDFDSIATRPSQTEPEFQAASACGVFSRMRSQRTAARGGYC